MSYSSTVLADGAVGYWRLGESSFGSAAVDAAGNANGTYVNTTGLTFSQTGIAGAGGNTAVLFTAANSGRVTVTTAGGQTGLGDLFTLETWAIRASTGSFQVLLCFGSPGPYLRFSTNNTITAGKQGTADVLASTSTIAADGLFHHYVWTKNGGTSHLYIDGIDVSGTVTNQTCANSSTLVIGADGTSFPMNGTLDEIAVYTSVLTPTQVANHYSLGSTAPSTLVPGNSNSDILLLHHA